MYATLLEQFQGALLGCALAELQSDLNPKLSRVLHEQGQIIQLTSKVQSAGHSQIALLAQSILLTMLHHDVPQDREQALSVIPHSFHEISGILVARLYGKPYLEGLSTEVMSTIEQSIAQQLPLQKATLILQALDKDTLWQAIVFAIYCWSCTPQHFMIAVRRAQHLSYLYTQQAWIPLVPALTGLMVGVTVGSRHLPPYPHHPDLLQTAKRLYGLWTGLSQRAVESPEVENTVIAQAGRLKPRSFQALSLNQTFD